MSDPQRVFVTGLGQVSALGTDTRSFFARLCAGEPSIQFIEGLDCPGLSRPIGARIPDWDARNWLAPRDLKTTWDVTHYAYAAAAQAFESARLDRIDRARGGVYLGTGFGGQGASELTYQSCFGSPGTRPKPTAIPTAMANASAGFLATEFRLKGPNLTILAACASATHAIGQAYHLLRTGAVDLMLAGGADAPLTPIILAAWNAMRVLAPPGDDPRTACRPFRQDRQGLVVGEGAGFLVLETHDHARRRGAEPLAELIGYGANADAGHITHPDLEGLTGCMALAIEDSRLSPTDVGYVNAHGTGTVINDRVEGEAMGKIFGDHSRHLMVSSTKAVHGHAMGASGALEAIATILGMREGRLPPTANLGPRELDPDLPTLDFIMGEARDVTVDVAMSSSFGFGGNNAAIILKRCV